jgi:hypothetical protein
MPGWNGGLEFQDMPDVDEITDMIGKSYITYFHCVRLVELLKVSMVSGPVSFHNSVFVLF